MTAATATGRLAARAWRNSARVDAQLGACVGRHSLGSGAERDARRSGAPVGARHSAHAARRFSTARRGTMADRGDSTKLTAEDLNRNAVEMEYSVRGKIVQLAEEHQAALSRGEKRPFDEVILCNVGNPQAVGQAPLTYLRQVLALCTYPALLDEPSLAHCFPEDVVAEAKSILDNSKGVGAYTTSKGIPLVRQRVAKFLEERDGYPADPESILLTNGASDGVKAILTLMTRGPKDGIMIPIPQYPLYSAASVLLDGAMLGYYLNEDQAWSLEVEELRRVVTSAKEKGVLPRVLCVISPGNPTGNLLTVQNMQDIVSFCEEQNLLLMADEVYQENIYDSTKEFVSFKKVVRDMNSDVPMVSFHSTSKGVMGECGLRGGYMELVNLDDSVAAQVYKLQSVSLCANVPGQIATNIMVNRPKPGSPSYELWEKEYNSTFQSLARKADKLAKGLNAIPGVSCSDQLFAMYAFPKIQLPPKAIQVAEKEGMAADAFYCMNLLQETGICVVPGSGFLQVPGTFHFRTTILPPEDKMDSVIAKLRDFHMGFCEKYA
ncbi:Alanine aminotransferase 2 [Porphyridium purpureum]|uniref:Alanine aminotransferase 2 n=1 Tax=Porphyridium purpureum TaxID=35688 RepID=A0A5J4YYI0_PORPP|nr:Alanine aminotransferase 2 [Porphyridium purpureum]|eukprot:POR9036..scf209_3